MIALQLQVNGNSLAPIGVAETLQPHQSHMQPKYVIGGRWLGTHKKYTDLFKGKISQMIFTRNVIKVCTRNFMFFFHFSSFINCFTVG